MNIFAGYKHKNENFDEDSTRSIQGGECKSLQRIPRHNKWLGCTLWKRQGENHIIRQKHHFCPQKKYTRHGYKYLLDNKNP